MLDGLGRCSSISIVVSPCTFSVCYITCSKFRTKCPIKCRRTRQDNSAKDNLLIALCV